jgi:adenine-specific DNA-methyltransferase
VFSFQYEDKHFFPSEGKSWKTNEDGMKKLAQGNRLFFSSDTLRYKLYFEDYPVQELSHMWMDTQGATDKEYVVQTSTKVVERCLLMTTDPGDLALDPTCGSGTTAYVAEQWGRRWITCDTSRVALALARTRLMAARFPYYILEDSPEGIQRDAEATGHLPPTPLPQTSSNIKKGFVYKRVPHVTLRSIANNADIKEGMTRAEIDAAIARHADTELLYDQPYEDPKRIRVTGPFTVESLSPYRLLSTDEERPVSEAEARKESSDGQFPTMIIENLKKAGVQNTFKNERLKFDRLESFAGIWIHASGEYTERDGKVRRVAVSIGPEHGTVGPEQVKEAAKEAVQGVGFDLLVVCGFAFDPHVSEEAKRYGKLMVMPTRMNYDLTMGDDLLKKTGAGNLFMYFGEPDIDVKPQKDGKLVVRIKGLDIYDPTTGQIRSHSTNDIACWFIDTNYNGESFFVRHAYFTGAEEPYDKLKRALRAEIDEAAWSALYSTTSRPFDQPKTGRIAIKVINHYGDEVLKVYDTKNV